MRKLPSQKKVEETLDGLIAEIYKNWDLKDLMKLREGILILDKGGYDIKQYKTLYVELENVIIGSE